jgi:hypothetical protein
MRCQTVLFVACLWAAVPDAATAQADPFDVEGHAFDRDTGDLLYVQRQHTTIVGGQRFSVVTYLGPDGDTLVVKQAQIGSSPAQPLYRLWDRRDGYVEGVEREGDCLRLFRRRADERDVHTRTLCHADGLVDDGVLAALDDHWDDLLEGARISIRVLVPNKLNSYRLRVHKVDEGHQDGRPTVTLRVEPASFLVRLIAPHVDLTCDAEDRRVLVYEGISEVGVTAGSGLRHRARVHFRYPAPVAVHTPGAGSR